MIRIARLEKGTPPSALAKLKAEALAQGHHHLERLIDTWSVSLSAPHSAFFFASHDNDIIGVGGVTPDPYEPAGAFLRMRRFYVLLAYRRGGIGRQLAEAAVAWATCRATQLSVRAPTLEAAAFWEALHFQRDGGPDRTHVRYLAAGEV